MKRWLIKDTKLNYLVAEYFETKEAATNYAKNIKDIEIVERVITHYEVFQTNFGHIYPMEFETFYDAVKYGESKGFEFHVVRHNPNNTTDVMAYWSPIGGLRFLEIEGDI